MSVKSYQFKDGTIRFKVYVNVRSSRNRKHRIQKYQEGFKTEKDAKAEEKRILEAAKREMGRQDGNGLLWADVLQNYKNTIESGVFGHGTDTANDYLSGVKTWTGPWLNRLATSIVVADGQDLIDLMEEEEKAPSCQNKIRKSVNAIFKWGIEKRPSLALTGDECKHLLRIAKERNIEWYPVWFTALYTGMRTGELKALRWSDIDFEKNIIKVAYSINSRSKKIKSTKTGEWRTVPVALALRSLLIEIKNNTTGEFVLPRIPDWMNNKQSLCLRRFLEAIGVRSVNFHALRATFATQMLDKGVPQTKVMDIGGWSDIRTFNIYIRLSGITVAGATECLDFDQDCIDTLL